MPLSTSFDSLQFLYQNELRMIRDVKFTFREIDIIACVIHNRGDKKIASICSISPRTASVHLYNIMGKLNNNSKDQIIDFIENSGKLAILKEYYIHLLIKASFEKYIIKLSHENKEKITYYYIQNEELEIDNNLFQSIKKHLSLSGITLSPIDLSTVFRTKIHAIFCIFSYSTGDK